MYLDYKKCTIFSDMNTKEITQLSKVFKCKCGLQIIDNVLYQMWIETCHNNIINIYKNKQDMALTS